MSDHTAKRQRTTGSFSPASPPYHAKPGDQTQTKTIVQPNTPTSPPYPSMSSHLNGRSTATGFVPLSEMTPPSSVTMSQHTSQLSTSATNPLPFPTPSSTAGGTFSTNVDSDGDAMMIDGRDDDVVRLGGHRLSNHNRQGKGAVPAAHGVSGKALFRFGNSSHEKSRPHGSQNLFELYRLNNLALSVARTDPTTGEKINKLRKSYEGHIKNMQIAGKPKAAKMDRVFTDLIYYPDEEYRIQKAKPISVALNPDHTKLSSEWDDLLMKSFAGMAPGPLPPAETQKYRNYLGTDEISKPKPGPEGVQNRGIPARTGTPLQGNAPAAAQGLRPARQGAKRSYDERSFAGYSEGYADNNFADSTGGEDNGQGSIKKRKLGFERTSHQVEVGGARR